MTSRVCVEYLSARSDDNVARPVSVSSSPPNTTIAGTGGALFGCFAREIRPTLADEGAVNCDDREGAPTAVDRTHEIIDVTIGVSEAQLRPFP